jgi:hypothetical protein
VTYLRINSPGVVHETVDGEVVIVNLDNGLYFSTDQVGTKLWGLVAAGRSRDDIVEWALGAYDADAEQVTADVTGFLAKLEEHQLVTVVDEPPEPAATAEPVEVAGSGYVAPDLQVYADMEELLLLDPVHDVGDAGWPNTA